MSEALLKKAIELAGELKHLLIATVAPDGMPHVAAAASISQTTEASVAVTAWFCPATVENLRTGKNVALVIWDPARDHGYQLLGRVERMTDLAQLDGYLPELEEGRSLPQVERELVIRVDGILDFKHAPHSDIELD
jgi:hypothetical protein